MTTESTLPLDEQLLRDFDVLNSIPAFKDYSNEKHRILRENYHLTFKEAVAVQSDCLQCGMFAHRAFAEYEEAFGMGITLAEIEQFRAEYDMTVFSLVHYRKVATTSETLQFLRRFDGIEYNHYVLLRKRGATHGDAMNAHEIGARFTEKYAACLGVVSHNKSWATRMGLSPDVILQLLLNKKESEQEEIHSLLHNGSCSESSDSNNALHCYIAALPT